MRIIVNPFFIFSAAFVIPASFYQFNLTDLYPPISGEMLVFLLATIGFSAILGISIHQKLWHQLKQGFIYPAFGKGLLSATLLVLSLSIVEIALLSDFPLARSLAGSGIEKRAIEEYGVPLLHPLILTLTSFLASYSFYLFLRRRKISFLILMIANFVPSIVFFSRGTLFVTIIVMFFLYLIQLRHLRPRVLFMVFLFAGIAVYLFGWAGNQRLGSRTLIFDYGRYQGDFIDAPLMSEFFWVYLYITSPLANFQSATEQPYFDQENAYGNYLLFEVAPSFLSKYLIEYLGIDKPSVDFISPVFNVATTFARPYLELSWIGATTMFIQVVLFILIFLRLLKPRNPFYPVGIAFLNTSVLMLIFDNSLVFTGTLLPLMFSVVIGSATNMISPLSHRLRTPDGKPFSPLKNPEYNRKQAIP